MCLCLGAGRKASAMCLRFAIGAWKLPSANTSSFPVAFVFSVSILWKARRPGLCGT